jgi:gluconolactonase
MFAAPPRIASTVLARLRPELQRFNAHSPAPYGKPLGSFFEGPVFDKSGRLYLVDYPNGRILRLTDSNEIEVAVEYDGEPNGLKFHPDGRLYIADYRNGIAACDLATGKVEMLVERPFGERFKGVNDLFIDKAGNVFFTDQGASGLQDPTGRVFCLTAGGKLVHILGGIPSPNGLAVSPDGRALCIAVTRGNSIWRTPISGLEIGKVGIFIQLSGSLGGPDGIAFDAVGNLAVAHNGLGVVWIFNRLGEPIFRIDTAAGLLTTNIAWGGKNGRTLYITESETGTILQAEVPLSE